MITVVVWRSKDTNYVPEFRARLQIWAGVHERRKPLRVNISARELLTKMTVRMTEIDVKLFFLKVNKGSVTSSSNASCLHAGALLKLKLNRVTK